MERDKKWEVGQEIIVKASDVNHVDDREIRLKYLGEGYLEDTSNGNKVWFNDNLFPTVFEGMCISLGLTMNVAVSESYEVTEIL